METNIIELKAAAKLIYQLGEQLIENEMVALLELIKNSYDADGTNVSIEIDSEVLTEYGRGKITIKDNGNGMTSEILKNDFFKIATSFKEKNKYSFKFKRRVLGEKGLGRLSFQRLGYYIRVVTKPNKEIFGENNDECFELLIDWRKLNSDINLNEVTAKLNTLKTDEIETISGTKIEIFGIKDISFWKKNKKDKEAFVKEIYKINSPIIQENIKDQFKIRIKIDSELFSNDEIQIDLLEGICDNKIDFSFKNGVFNIVGEFSQNSINSMINKGVTREFKKEDILFIEKNNNKLEEIKKYRISFSINEMLEKISSNKNLNKTEEEIYKYIKKINFNLKNNFEIYNPGNFYGKIYNVRFATEKQSELRSLIKNEKLHNISDYKALRDIWNIISGFYIYKNSFRILPYGNKGFDWAGFDYYNKEVKYNTYEYKSILGYLIIENENNLVEQTNRQGFIKDSYGENFFKLIEKVLVPIVVGKYRKLLQGFDLNKNELKKEIITSINKTYKIKNLNYSIENPEEKFEEIKKEMEKEKESSKSSYDNKVDVRPESNLEKKIKEYEEIYKKNKKMEEIKENIVENERKELSTLLPMAGQSIIIESMTHEFNRIKLNIRGYAKKTISGLDNNLEKALLKSWQNSILTETIFLSEQLSHLEPTYKKNNKYIETISLKKIVEQLYLEESPMSRKAKKLNIKVYVEGEELKVNANKGYVVTIFDNLFLNSLYWVERNISEKEKHIKIKLSSDGFVEFSDSGKGISQENELLIYKPFVSEKPDGRGLGLYIVESLLEEMNATITLADEFNEYGNKNKFILEFHNIVKENTLF